MEEYYVYMYLRKDGTPYYVGKGKNNRVKTKHNIKVPKDPSRVLFVAENLEESHAFDLEVWLIALYGRKDKGGILWNMTDGGQGVSGRACPDEVRDKIKRGWTEERKAAHIARMTGNQINKGRKNGSPSQETRDKIAKANTGKKRSDETIEKLRIIGTGLSHKRVRKENGQFANS